MLQFELILRFIEVSFLSCFSVFNVLLLSVIFKIFLYHILFHFLIWANAVISTKTSFIYRRNEMCKIGFTLSFASVCGTLTFQFVETRYCQSRPKQVSNCPQLPFIYFETFNFISRGFGPKVDQPVLIPQCPQTSFFISIHEMPFSYGFFEMLRLQLCTLFPSGLVRACLHYVSNYLL